MIGLALITFVAVLGNGVRASFTDAVNELFIADYALTGGFEPVSIEVAAVSSDRTRRRSRLGDPRRRGRTRR